jgi:hypothetical protein
MRAGLVIEGIDAAMGIGEGDESDGSGEPELFELGFEGGGLFAGDGAVADPGEFADDDLPELGPATWETLESVEFEVGGFAEAGGGDGGGNDGAGAGEEGLS